MSITNLTNQYISASFKNIAQVETTGELYNGLGTQITTLNLTTLTVAALTASYISAVTISGSVTSASYAINSGTTDDADLLNGLSAAAFAKTGSNTFNGNQTIIGDVTTTGTITAKQFIVSSSVVNLTTMYSSGSTQFGDTSDDTHQFIGKVTVTGSLTISGSSTFRNIGPAELSGSVSITGSVNIIGGTLNWNGSEIVTSTNLGPVATTASLNALSSSIAPQIATLFALSASITPQLNSINSTTGSFATTSSLNSLNDIVNVLVINTGSYATTSSLNSLNGIVTSVVNVTGSYATTSSLNLVSSAVDSINSKTGSFATTGSNTFNASQTISGSLTITQDLIVLGSSSIQYITSSQLNISDNIITVNTFTPSIRFGGLAVIDSGSSPQRSGSMLFDSTNDQWIFVHQNNVGAVTSSVVLMGPQTYNNVGTETNLTTNYLVKSVNAEHLGDSIISESGGAITVGGSVSATVVTVGTTAIDNNAITLTDVGTTNNLGGYVKTEFRTYNGGASATIVIPVDFTSYTESVFAKYVINDNDAPGVNMRIGTVMATSNKAYSGNDVTISDISATDIGDTGGLVFTCTDATEGIDLDFSVGSADWKIYLEITRIRM